jgi:hypothetical protein
MQPQPLHHLETATASCFSAAFTGGCLISDDLFAGIRNMEPTPMASSSTATFVPYPLLNHPTTRAPLTSTIVSIPTRRTSITTMVADKILDEAVDELFRNDPMMEDMMDLDDISKMWLSSSTAAFGEDILVRDDAQLAFLLERILEE